MSERGGLAGREHVSDVLSVCHNCLGGNIAPIQNVLGGMLQSSARKQKPPLEWGAVSVQRAKKKKS